MKRISLSSSFFLFFFFFFFFRHVFSWFVSKSSITINIFFSFFVWSHWLVQLFVHLSWCRWHFPVFSIILPLSLYFRWKTFFFSQGLIEQYWAFYRILSLFFFSSCFYYSVHQTFFSGSFSVSLLLNREKKRIDKWQITFRLTD